MAKSPASINLLSKRESKSDTILKWALTTGRFIIIVTETIALAAFAYRFTLDRQIIDLHDKIKQNQSIISFYSADEERYRTLQTKLQTLSTLDSQSTEVTGRIDDIIEIARGKVVLESLTMGPNSVKISANTRTITLMNSFVDSLKKYPGTAGITITQIENKTDTGVINIALEVNLKPKKG